MFKKITLFSKIAMWIDELLHGKARRIAELEKKVKTLENIITPNTQIFSNYDKAMRLMNDNTQTIHYLLSKKYKVKLVYEHMGGYDTPITRIVSEE